MSFGRITSLFNYLRGSEVDLEDASAGVTRSSLSRESIKMFLKYTFQLTSKLFPSIFSAPTLTFLALLIDVVLLEVVIYRVGLLSGISESK